MKYTLTVNFDQVVLSSIAKCSLVQLLRGKDADHYMQNVYSVPHSLCTAFVRTVLRIWTTCALKIANVSSDIYELRRSSNKKKSQNITHFPVLKMYIFFFYALHKKSRKKCFIFSLRNMCCIILQANNQHSVSFTLGLPGIQCLLTKENII